MVVNDFKIISIFIMPRNTGKPPRYVAKAIAPGGMQTTPEVVNLAVEVHGRSGVLVSMVNAKQFSNEGAGRQPAADRPRAATGRFVSYYAEKRGDAIALRLPKSLDERLRHAVGWRSKADNKALTTWIEAAIAEKLQQVEDS